MEVTLTLAEIDAQGSQTGRELRLNLLLSCIHPAEERSLRMPVSSGQKWRFLLGDDGATVPFLNKRKGARMMRIGCHFAALLALVAVLTTGWRTDVRAAELSPEQVEEGQKFVINNAIFILFHEAGHMLVSELGLPVLGREEDAVDALSSVLLLGAEDEELYTTMQDSADGWFLLDEAKEDGPQEDDFMGTHGLDRQRAYSIVCMMTGANAEFFKEFADSLDFPQARREECVHEYQRTRDSWMSLLGANMKDGQKTKFTVTYEPAGNDDLQGFAELLKSAGALETIATVFGEGYDLADGIKLTGKTCGTENAFWNPADREITYCYEMAAFHAGLISTWFEKQDEEAEQDGDAEAEEPQAETSGLGAVKLKK